MPQIYYKQSVTRSTNAWSWPMKTKDPAWREPEKVKWSRVKKSAMSIFSKTPFAINKIERWHKCHGHSVVRSNRVHGKYRTTYLMITIP